METPLKHYASTRSLNCRKIFQVLTTQPQEMEWPYLVIYLAGLGLTSGLVMSLIGASAVMVIVPGLTIVLNMAMHKAIGVSLLVDVIASLAVGYAYWRHGNVDLRQGFWIALGSIVGAQLGAGVTLVIPGIILGISYGIWMVGAGAMIWSKGLDRTKIADRFYEYVRFESHTKQILVCIILGLIIGLNSGIFGAGGGVLIMLVLMFVLDYPIHSAIGTSTIIMAITAASATLGYMYRGNVDVTASLIVAAGTVVGGVSGARFANLVSEKILSKVVGALFILLGLVMTILRFI